MVNIGYIVYNISMVGPEIPDNDNPEIRPMISVIPAMDETSAAVRSLLEGSTIEDPADRKIVEAALAFLEHPTEDLEETRRYLDGIGMVLAYNYDEIEDQPSALSDINCRLFLLASRQFIKLIEEELAKSKPDTNAIRTLINDALNSTGVLVTYYNDNTLRNRVIELQKQLEQMLNDQEV